MSMRNYLATLALGLMGLMGLTGLTGLTLASAASPALAAGPGLGEPIAAAEIALWNIDIGPDGDGLPPGQGTVEDGRALYEEKCLACHGEGGKDGIMDALAGGIGSLDGPKPVRTVGSYWPYAPILFDYIRRAMPLPAPMSLTDDEVYALAAHILHLNGIVAADAVMDATALPKVAMPNRDGFYAE